jgi:putative peptidoglycan lipid II flippase
VPDSPSTSALPSSRARAATPRPLQAAILLSAAYFLSRIVGLVQLLIIRALLPPDSSDAYSTAFQLPDFVNYLVAGGAMSVTFIPIFTELSQHEDERAKWRFFSTVATIMALALTVLIALGMLFAEPIVRVIAPGFNAPEKAATLAKTVAMTRILLPAQLFFYLGGMLVGVLNAHKRFGVSGFNGVLYNLVAIVVGVLVWRVSPDTGFAWGILVGALCGSFLLPLAATLSAPRAQRLKYFVALDWRLPAVKRFFVNALPIMLGVSLPVVDQQIVVFFASELPKGAVADLWLGNRFMLAPLGIVAQAASVAAFPYLAADSVSRDWKKFSEFLRVGLRRLMFITLPMSVLLILISQPLLRLFRFGHLGNTSAQHSAEAFAFFCVALFAWAGQQLVARGFYALQDTRTPTIIGSLLTVLFFIPLAWWMTRWGVLGLALATSIGATAHFVSITIALDRKLRRRRFDAPLYLERLLGTLLRTGLACLMMGMMGLLVNFFALKVLSTDKIGDLLRILMVGSVASAVFVACAGLFSIPEWKWLRDKLIRRRA